jgi:hypothetical protein
MADDAFYSTFYDYADTDELEPMVPDEPEYCGYKSNGLVKRRCGNIATEDCYECHEGRCDEHVLMCLHCGVPLCSNCYDKHEGECGG